VKKSKKDMETEGIRLRADGEYFDKMVDRYMKSSPTYKAAYEAAEGDHEQLTGHRRYVDHESYRQSRRYRLKNKRK
jgi:hypothetical protein